MIPWPSPTFGVNSLIGLLAAPVFGARNSAG